MHEIKQNEEFEKELLTKKEILQDYFDRLKAKAMTLAGNEFGQTLHMDTLTLWLSIH